jgi:predicted small integral membrane protein
MMEALFETVLVAIPGLWMAFGVADNIRHPEVNRADVARVLRMEALDDWPDVKAEVGHRRIDNPAVLRLFFGIIVMAESLAAILLLAGAAALGALTLGLVQAPWPWDLAKAGAVAFCCVWGGMLVGGQWFHYWYGPYGQATHLMAFLWGLGTYIALSV